MQYNVAGRKIAEAKNAFAVKQEKYAGWYPNGKKQFEGYFKTGNLNRQLASLRMESQQKKMAVKSMICATTLGLYIIAS